MCLASAFFFHFSPSVCRFIVQASDNAANWKRTIKVKSSSYWLSLTQLKTNVSFFSAFRKHSLLHESLFHDTYRLRRLTSFGFRITDTKNQSLIGRVWCSQKIKNVKRDTNAPAMLCHFYLYDKLDTALSDDSFILSENSLPAVLELKHYDWLKVYDWLKSIFEDSKTCYQRYGKRNLWDW